MLQVSGKQAATQEKQTGWEGDWAKIRKEAAVVDGWCIRCRSTDVPVVVWSCWK